MKFTCLKENLSRCLNSVSRIVSTRPSLPVLANVYIEAENNKLKLSATDLEIGINTWIGADVSEEGKTTVSAKMFAEFINSLPKGKIEVEQVKGQLVVKAENNEAQFNVLSADEFPPVATSNGDPFLTLDTNVFSKAIERVTIATSLDEARPILTGVLFEGSENVLTLVGVDGFRLSKQIIDLPKKLETEINLVVPSKALIEIARSAADLETTEEISDKQSKIEAYLLKDKNQVVFKYQGIDVVSRLLEGKYPDYKQVIPTGYQTRFEADYNDFQNAVKIANIFARNDLNNKVVMKVNNDTGKITLSASLVEVGRNKTEFDGKVEGKPIEIGFRTKYLIEMLSQMEEGGVIFEANDSSSAGVFKMKDNSDFLHIIMPMMVDK